MSSKWDEARRRDNEKRMASAAAVQREAALERKRIAEEAARKAQEAELLKREDFQDEVDFSERSAFWNEE